MYTTTLIISSNVAYYLDFFETIFLDFLTDSGASKKTQDNYRTDIRHFFVWFIDFLASVHHDLPKECVTLLSFIGPDTLINYKQFLNDSNVAIATINRRLSSLRSFFKFCQTKNWITVNPSDSLVNVSKNHLQEKELQPMVTGFYQHLLQNGFDHGKADLYRREVNAFLQWMKKNV